MALDGGEVNGAHTLTAVARDGVGNQTTSAGVSSRHPTRRSSTNLPFRGSFDGTNAESRRPAGYSPLRVILRLGRGRHRAKPRFPPVRVDLAWAEPAPVAALA
jgi:hypothetical protein